MRLPARLALAVPALVAAVPAQTIVGGLLTANTRWVASASPYLATATVVVTNGATLQIDPGVEVQFTSGSGLTVGAAASLDARGTATSPIKLTRAASSAAWQGVAFTSGAVDAVFNPANQYVSGCILEHCSIAFGGAGGAKGAVSCDQATPFLSKTEVVSSSSRGMYVLDPRGTVVVSDCIVANAAGYGIDVESSAAGGGFRCLRTSVSSCKQVGILYQTYSLTQKLPGLIEGNVVQGCDQGIVVGGTGGAPPSIVLRQNRVARCSSAGIYVGFEGNPVMLLSVEDCVVTESGYGFQIGSLAGSGSFTLTGCVALRNTLGGYAIGGLPSYETISLSRCVAGLNAGSGVNIGTPGPLARTLLVEDCRLFENNAKRGGGLLSSGSVTIRRCELVANTATVEGGGLCIDTAPTVDLRDCTFLGNSAPKGDDVCVTFAATKSAVATTCRFAGPRSLAAANTIWDNADNPGVGTLVLVSPSAGDPFAGVGSGVAGVTGEPALVGSGPLTASSTARFDLSSAAPNALTVFVLGARSAYAPGFAGYLVPDTAGPVLYGVTATDGNGRASLAVPGLPALPTGVRVLAQAFVLDLQAPAGIAMSNGVLGVAR